MFLNFTTCFRLVHNEASKERQKQIRQYVLSRYMQYVQQYASVLEKKFPAAMRVYRVFTIGIKVCGAKIFFKLQSINLNVA